VISPVIRVVLIDDSAVVRGAMRQIIDGAPDMHVVATAGNGRLGLEELARTETDVVLLDVEMPELDGLSTLPLILARYPKVRVIMASSLTAEGATTTMDALARGATDYITKPSSRAGPVALASLATEIVAKIRAIGMAGQSRRNRVVAAPRPAAPAARPTPHPVSAVTPRIVAISSSTGGPNALVTVMKSLPRSFSLPVVVTQHMPPVFTMLLAQRLRRESGRDCGEGVDGEPIAPNRVYVAPGDFHMLVEARHGLPHLRLTQTPPENHCRPSADPMLRSVAAVYGPAVLSVVLTGMGEDGRRGSEDLRRLGGRVIAQDEATSVVWGMPGAVVEAGIVEKVLPLEEIGQRIGAICGVLT
jgi:two-component system chemotaxis response regulator CheB